MFILLPWTRRLHHIAHGSQNVVCASSILRTLVQYQVSIESPLILNVFIYLKDTYVLICKSIHPLHFALKPLNKFFRKGTGSHLAPEVLYSEPFCLIQSLSLSFKSFLLYFITELFFFFLESGINYSPQDEHRL